MNNTKKLISVSAILISLLLSACSEASDSKTFSIDSGAATSQQAVSTSYPASPTPESRQASDSMPVNAVATDASNKTDISDDKQQTVPNLPQSPFTIEDIIPYSGQPYITVNNNIPYFSEEDFNLQSFAVYSALDDLNRCGPAYASIGIDIMPTKERDAIGYIKPSGWHTVKYNDIIDGNYLYNRCHLIGYQLCGENDEKNLFTGTRYLNVQGMQPFENMVADYVNATENHVLYRVTPVFEGDNLLASGILMEAESIEDRGEYIQFCVYVYNIQPGIIIDHSTGESSLAPDMQTEESASAAVRLPDSTAEPTVEPASQPASEPTAEPALQPTPEPTTAPTPEPTAVPTPEPTAVPTPQPTPESTATPTLQPTPEPTAAPTPQPTPEPTITPAETPTASKEDEPKSTTYILNTNTMKFHVPYCRNVKQIKDKNRQEYTGTRDEIISHGYAPCKNCNP